MAIIAILARLASAPQSVIISGSCGCVTLVADLVPRNVKGVLFADYVRMIRGQKGVDWSAQLAPADLPFLQQRIEPAQWYPMESFERLGVAILRHVALGDMNAVRMWGRFSADELRAKN